MLLNLDAGELPSETKELWAEFDVLNIACRGHAGDMDSMRRVVRFCVERSIAIGAHPSYPDREGFGRRTIEITPNALERTIAEQCTMLAAIAHEHGTTVTSMKPHGALYHDTMRGEEIAGAVIRGAIAALGGNLVIVGPQRGALHDAAAATGLAYRREGFADRRMRADGSLVPRSEPDAVITDPRTAAEQARRLTSEVDTICVHADTPNAIAIARAVREALR